MTDAGSRCPYLAFDTSGGSGSVAVGIPGERCESVILAAREEHAARLVPAIDEALTRAGTTVSELAGVVVGEGPGSFTGVRVAAATAKGLCGALGLPLWSASSLAATALVSGVGPVRYVLFDARRDRVYGACYRVASDELQTLIEPHGGTVDEVLGDALPAECSFTGDAAEKHRAKLENAGFRVEYESDAPPPLAGGLLLYRARRPEEAPVADVATWEPRYVRVSSVERTWSA